MGFGTLMAPGRGIAGVLAPIAWAWLALAAAFAWKMLFGGAFYARPVLGNYWMRQVNLDPANVKKEDATMGLAWAAAWSLVGVALFNVLWSWTGAGGAAEGAMVGGAAGLGLAATAAMVHPVFEGRPNAVMWLYGVYHVIEWVGVGVVFGLLA